MIFLCGLFFPIEQLPIWLRPLSYLLPLTYGVDILHAGIHRTAHLSPWLDFLMLAVFCAGLFGISLRRIQRTWIG
jgi:ABC-2 type transport system permease protein